MTLAIHARRPRGDCVRTTRIAVADALSKMIEEKQAEAADDEGTDDDAEEPRGT